MVIWVIEFSRKGYKTREIFDQESISSKESIVLTSTKYFTKGNSGESKNVPKSEFQREFSMSEMNRISLIFSFKNIHIGTPFL